jgi:NitT/TauT family transport system ATP-binding protein
MAQAVPHGGNEVLPVSTPPASGAGAPTGLPTRTGPVILEADLVTKTFTTPDGRALPVLDDVSFRLREGEIVALLGKSGSGKSTLLRCIAGLIAPSAGTVTYRGTPLNGANPGVAMVFQSFALLPWLTVQQNVELAMQARDVPEAARRDRALRVIDLIGLDGFESAYPKELSGGMRQRVGFARALAVEPDALLMDEPFSALDVLTAANLRGELTRLWENREFPTKAVLIVTHNIEEAVVLADRILVLSSNPGRIRAELHVGLPRPRDRHDPAFEQLVDTVYGILTGREDDAERAVASAEAASSGSPAATPVDMPLPEVSAPGLSGLLEILAARGGQDGLAELAEDLSFEVDDLLPLVDAAEMLGLAEVHDAQLELTEAGREFAAADIDASKILFGKLASERAPLIKAIMRALHATNDGTLREGFFLDLLRRGFTTDEARHQLDIAIDWGRYGELFEYDAESGQLKLEPDPAAVAALSRTAPLAEAEPLREGPELLRLFVSVGRGGRDHQAVHAAFGVRVNVGGGHVDRSPAGVLQQGRVPARVSGRFPHELDLAGPLGLGNPAAGKIAVAAQAGPAGRGAAVSPDVNRERRGGLGEAAYFWERDKLTVEADAVLAARPQQL